MIEFIDRKFGNNLNSQFYLHAGLNTADVSHFLVGDHVSLILRLTPEQVEAINVAGLIGIPRVSEFFHLTFVVKRRCHGVAINPDNPGTMQDLSMSIKLEAATGNEEDLFRWLVCGEQPAWETAE